MAITKLKNPASSEPDIGLGGNARKEVARALSQVLADSYLLQLKTQFYHWNVTGTHFSSLHLLFEGQYNALATAVDEIAERIRTLGHNAPGTFREFQELSSLREDKSLPGDWQTMVKNLLQAHEGLAQETRGRIETAQKAGDEGTADLFIRRLQEHEKAAWMLRSYLQ